MKVSELHEITLHLNGKPYSCKVEARRTLADTLRHELHHPGTHLGCEHGICGACTVIVDGMPLRSCLLYAVQLDGCEVETVEGLAGDGELNSLQRAFANNFALQCGFCTPGFLMLCTAYLREHHEPTDDQVREVVASNLCRCTGYSGIVDAVIEEAASRKAAE